MVHIFVNKCMETAESIAPSAVLVLRRTSVRMPVDLKCLSSVSDGWKRYAVVRQVRWSQPVQAFSTGLRWVLLMLQH